MRFTNRKTLFTDRAPLLSIRSIRTDRHMAYTVRYGAVYWITPWPFFEDINFSCLTPQFIYFHIKGAMSPHTYARANENKLEKIGASFSSSVGDFGRLFLSV